MRPLVIALVALGVLVGAACEGGDDAPSTPSPILPRSPDHSPDSSVGTANSTVEDVLNDPGDEINTVRRGESHASFAGGTGAVLEWDVRPQGEFDLEPLRPN
jgi:hypothetical protein